MMKSSKITQLHTLNAQSIQTLVLPKDTILRKAVLHNRVPHLEITLGKSPERREFKIGMHPTGWKSSSLEIQKYLGTLDINGDGREFKFLHYK